MEYRTPKNIGTFYRIGRNKIVHKFCQMTYPFLSKVLNIHVLIRDENKYSYKYTHVLCRCLK